MEFFTQNIYWLMILVFIVSALFWVSLDDPEQNMLLSRIHILSTMLIMVLVGLNFEEVYIFPPIFWIGYTTYIFLVMVVRRYISDVHQFRNRT